MKESAPAAQPAQDTKKKAAVDERSTVAYILNYTWRIVRGVGYMIFLVFTVFVSTALFQIPGLLCFYPFSRSLWRSFNSLFIEWWCVIT